MTTKEEAEKLDVRTHEEKGPFRGAKGKRYGILKKKIVVDSMK